MKKILTFKEFLEKEKNREDILKGSSKLDEVLESATRINDISLSNSALAELVNRNNKLQSIIDNSSFTALRESAERIKIDTSSFENIYNFLNSSELKSKQNYIDIKKLNSLSNSYKWLFSSIAPFSKLYESEIQKLKKEVSTVNLKNLLISESFNKAKELQNEIIKIDPRISKGVRPLYSYVSLTRQVM